MIRQTLRCGEGETSVRFSCFTTCQWHEVSDASVQKQAIERTQKDRTPFCSESAQNQGLQVGPHDISFPQDSPCLALKTPPGSHTASTQGKVFVSGTYKGKPECCKGNRPPQTNHKPPLLLLLCRQNSDPTAQGWDGDGPAYPQGAHVLVNLESLSVPGLLRFLLNFWNSSLLWPDWGSPGWDELHHFRGIFLPKPTNCLNQPIA